MTDCWFCGKDGHKIESKFHIIGFDEKSLREPCVTVRTKSPCPPFANCCEKELVERLQTDIPITYCPICGRKVFENEVKPKERSNKDIIKDMREIVKPFISDCLKRVNYEGKGEIDKAEFETEFEKVLTLAEKAETLSENKGEWIPVFERLPEDYDRVLITINGCRGLIVRESQYHKAQNEFEVLHNHERWEVGEKGLIAWQPLPKPYKKGE